MARRFDGVDDVITFATGALATADAGPLTVVVLAKLNDVVDGAFFHTRTSVGGSCTYLECFGGNLNYGQAATGRDVGNVATTDGWCLFAARKGDGGAAVPQGRVYVLSSGTGTTVTAASALSDGPTPGAGGSIQVGAYAAVEFLSADIAVAGAWTSLLSDSQIDGLAASLAAWTALSPAWLVAFDQAAVTDPVLDLSATGTGDQTARTGTTVVADPPGFTYGAGGTTATVGTATDTNTAQPLGRAKTRTAGVAAETGTAQPLGRAKTRPAGVAADTAAAQPVGRAKTTAIAAAAGADAARPVGQAKTRPVGVAAQTEAALPITAAAGAAVIGAAGDTGTALPLARAKTTITGRAAGVEAALPVERGKRRTLGPAADTGDAAAFGRAKTRPVGAAGDTGTALPITSPDAPRPVAGPPLVTATTGTTWLTTTSTSRALVTTSGKALP